MDKTGPQHGELVCEGRLGQWELGRQTTSGTQVVCAAQISETVPCSWVNGHFHQDPANFWCPPGPRASFPLRKGGYAKGKLQRWYPIPAPCLSKDEPSFCSAVITPIKYVLHIPTVSMTTFLRPEKPWPTRGMSVTFLLWYRSWLPSTKCQLPCLHGLMPCQPLYHLAQTAPSIPATSESSFLDWIPSFPVSNPLYDFFWNVLSTPSPTQIFIF